MKKYLFQLFIKSKNSLLDRNFIDYFKKFPCISSLYKIIYKIIKPKGIVLVNVQGNKMYVNCQDESLVPSLLVYGIYEKYDTELFKKIVKPGMIVVDIGANIGYYTLMAAKLIGSNGKVYAFEPEPSNYELLIKNIKINNYTNIISIQKAVSNKNGKARLFINKSNLGNSSLIENNVPQKIGFTEVETITLDNFFDSVVKNNKIDFIKMDTQGAEKLVIEGAEKILKDNNLKIIMEFWPFGLRNMGSEPSDLLKMLQDFGFKIKHINGKDSYLKKLEMTEIINLCENKDKKNKMGYINLFLEK